MNNQTKTKEFSYNQLVASADCNEVRIYDYPALEAVCRLHLGYIRKTDSEILKAVERVKLARFIISQLSNNSSGREYYQKLKTAVDLLGRAISFVSENDLPENYLQQYQMRNWEILFSHTVKLYESLYE